MAEERRSISSDPTEDRIAAATARARQAMRSGVASATRAQVKEQVKETPKVAAQVEEEIDVAQEAAIAFKIKENPFYAIMTDTQSSQEDKILAIANALDPKQLSMHQVRENYRLFQEYYTFIQSEELEEALDNVKRLIKELESNTKVEVTTILKNLEKMLGDVDVSRQLVEVMRHSRITGESIKQMSEAMRRNEQIERDLAVLSREHEAAQKKVDAAGEYVDGRIAERDTEESRFGARFLRALPFGRPDTTFSDRVLDAQDDLEAAKLTLGAIEDRTKALEAERRADLEEGPLKILRSVDEVGDNLTDYLISSGNAGISTIQGAQKSVLQLMGRTLFSEGEVDKIARRVADKQITLTVLQSGLNQATSSTNDFKLGIEDRSMTAEAELALAESPMEGANPNVLDIAKKKTAAINLKVEAGEVIEYQSRLVDTITEMNLTISQNIKRQGESDGQKKIIQGTKKSVTTLGRDTLTTVAGNLEGVLHNLHADTTDELQGMVVAFSAAAEQVGKDSMTAMATRAKEMHDKDMELLDNTITRLKESREMIAAALETSVDEGIERAEKQRSVKEATSGLESAIKTMRTVVGEMSNEAVSSGPARPGEAAAKEAEEAPAAEPTAAAALTL